MKKTHTQGFQNPERSMDKQANRFLDRFGLTIHADLLGSDVPPWGEGQSHDHFRVSVMDKGEERAPLEFDYWASLHSTEKNYRPTNYEILACLSEDLRVDPTNLWWAEDHRDVILAHQDNISRFFTGDELAEIPVGCIDRSLRSNHAYEEFSRNPNLDQEGMAEDLVSTQVFWLACSACPSTSQATAIPDPCVRDVDNRICRWLRGKNHLHETSGTGRFKRRPDHPQLSYRTAGHCSLHRVASRRPEASPLGQGSP